jgi:long-chain fatty acid transport protein
MMKKTVLAAVIAAASVSVPVAQASNGYFSYGYGTKNKGMAGASVALPQDAMAAAVNPAGTVHVGERIDAGISVFSPPREYTQNEDEALSGGGMPPLPIGSNPDFTGTVESDKDFFLVPHFAYTAPIDEHSAYGIALYGNGGMNTTYEAADTTMGMGTFGAGKTGVDLAQLFINANYARKLSSELSVGAAAIVAVQRFAAKGLTGFAPLVADGVADDLSNNGYDYSYGVGASAGALWQPNAQWAFGASVQSRMYMTEFDDYSDLLAEQGDFDIPANATIGLAFSPRDDLTFVADVQRIWYSDIGSLGNAMSANVVACFGGDANACLGADGGAGFGWDDMTIYKLGVQWDVEPDLTLRFGYSKTDQPVPTSGVLFNVLAPAVVEEHFTAGLTKRFADNQELSLSLMYAPENDLDCGCTLPMTGGPESINIAMEQWEVELSYAWRF